MSRMISVLPLALLLTGAWPNGLGGARMVSIKQRNPIQIENARRGFPGWASGLTDASVGTTKAAIQGYASEVSALPGQTVHLHVRVDPAADYRIEVFRLGWYRGTGARLMGCFPGCRKSKHGTARPIPTADRVTGEIAAQWPVTDPIRTPRSWLSGYYIAKLVLTSGPHRGKSNYVPFVLRATRRSTLLVQASVNTWEAYNNWGGKSLYPFNSNNAPATKVSFNRPFSSYNTFFVWEYPLVRFLERGGYDVSYTTDVDTDLHPGELRRHRLVIVSGHGEYWSKGERDAFDAAESGGINLAFLGADISDWQIRYEDSRRTIVEYRDARLDPEPDPSLKTIRFRDLSPPRPQCQLLGIEYQGGFRSDYAKPTDYRVNPAAIQDRWFAGTGFNSSSTLPGLVGYEWDGVKPGCHSSALTVLFHASGPPDADAVRLVAPSGAQVFSSGSLQLVWGLDDWGQGKHVDPRLRRFMANALADLTKG
jgi:N,N-dimethylformamidase beta subunit-like, C-terminal